MELALQALADVPVADSGDAGAYRAAEESLTLFEEIGDRWGQPWRSTRGPSRR